jgi:hypothetical protein
LDSGPADQVPGIVGLAYRPGMDDLDTNYFVMRALAGPMMAIATMMVTITILAPIALYVIARWRANREPEADRQLGLKVALHYFANSAFQLGLAGLTLLVWAMISSMPSEVKSPFYRIALGMIVPAGLVFAAHRSLLRRTNDAQVASVRRLFGGYNLLVVGLIGFVALVFAFEALFQKGNSGEAGRIAGAMVLVYGTAWSIIGWRYGRLVLGGGASGSGSAAPPAAGVSPPPAAASGTGTPAAAASSGSGLPSLGGGAFPPIEPKS